MRTGASYVCVSVYGMREKESEREETMCMRNSQNKMAKHDWSLLILQMVDCLCVCVCWHTNPLNVKDQRTKGRTIVRSKETNECLLWYTAPRSGHRWNCNSDNEIGQFSLKLQ